MIETILTTAEAAKKTGLARTTILAHIARHDDFRKLCRKLGRDWIITPDGMAWLKNRRTINT